MAIPAEYSLSTAVETMRQFLLTFQRTRPFVFGMSGEIYKERTGKELDLENLGENAGSLLHMASRSDDIDVVRMRIVLAFDIIHNSSAGKQFVENKGKTALEALFDGNLSRDEFAILYKAVKAKNKVLVNLPDDVSGVNRKLSYGSADETIPGDRTLVGTLTPVFAKMTSEAVRSFRLEEEKRLALGATAALPSGRLI